MHDIYISDSARYLSQDIFPPVYSSYPEELLIIKECHEEIFIKLVIVLKISKYS
jgi:hypothetical protein